LLKDGAQSAVASLAKASKIPWTLNSIVSSRPDEEILDNQAAAAKDDHYGCLLGTFDADFLVVFPRKAGYLITHNFTRAASRRIDAITRREHKALSEVSSIMINGLIAPLAAARGREMLLSAPYPMLDTPPELLKRTLIRIVTPTQGSSIIRIRLGCSSLDSGCLILGFFKPTSLASQ
jgi:hypothetical protein